jgi:hypothetical protein
MKEKTYFGFRDRLFLFSLAFSILNDMLQDLLEVIGRKKSTVLAIDIDTIE